MKWARLITTEGQMAVALRKEDQYLNVTPALKRLGMDGRSVPLEGQIRSEVARRLSVGEEEAEAVSPGHFLPPVEARQIIAIGLNYRSHAEEMGRPLPSEPVVFAKSPSSALGHLEPVQVPGDLGRTDFEAEVAAIIGRQARFVSREKAHDTISGYCLLNDLTLRDLQSKASQGGLPWFLAKSPDTYCPMGPYLVPSEDVDDPNSIEFLLRVNGETRQQGTTADMVFSVAHLIEYITRFITLEPGDVVATGTPSGVGPVEPGDVMVIHSPQLGTLENPVVRLDS